MSRCRAETHNMGGSRNSTAKKLDTDDARTLDPEMTRIETQTTLSFWRWRGPPSGGPKPGMTNSPSGAGGTWT
ncbi:unnamed protein product [Arctogadus glacialis]